MENVNHSHSCSQVFKYLFSVHKQAIIGTFLYPKQLSSKIPFSYYFFVRSSVHAAPQLCPWVIINQTNHLSPWTNSKFAVMEMAVSLLWLSCAVCHQARPSPDWPSGTTVNLTLVIVLDRFVLLVPLVLIAQELMTYLLAILNVLQSNSTG